MVTARWLHLLQAQLRSWLRTAAQQLVPFVWHAVVCIPLSPYNVTILSQLPNEAK
jgi:hypothetical protein